MIIVRTPLRVSFFGGGTDHPSWYLRNGRGAVLSTSIDKYVYITLRNLPPIFDFNYRIAWRIVEQTKTVAEIQHPVVRAVLENYTGVEAAGFEIVYHADLPARSGLGSSSAFTVAALHAMLQHRGLASPKQVLAREAIRVEQELLSEPVGSQDQVAVAYGGLNRIDFSSTTDISVSEIDISPRRKRLLEDHLMMFFTGFTRDAGAIEKLKIQSFDARSREMERLYDLVGQGQEILENPNLQLSEFGGLLHDAWMQKRALAPSVSNAPIDAAYDAARRAGASGGKLLGAGGGGFLLVFAPPEKHSAVTSAICAVDLGQGRRAKHVPIRFEGEGSSVVLHKPEFAANFASLAAANR